MLRWEPTDEFSLTGDQLAKLTNYVFDSVSRSMGHTATDKYTEIVSLYEAQKVLSDILDQGVKDGKVSDDESKSAEG